MNAGYPAKELQIAFRLDMRDMAANGEVWRFHQLVTIARSTLSWHETSVLRPVYAELVAVDAVIRFFSSAPCA